MEKNTRHRLKGIRGWLILAIIVLMISVGIHIFDAIISVISLGKGLSSLYLKQTLLDCIIIAFGIYALIQIFRKSRKAPLIAMTFLWMNVLINIFIFLIVFAVTPLTGRAGLGLVIGLHLGIEAMSAIGWTFYFIKSKRVKNTFIQ